MLAADQPNAQNILVTIGIYEPSTDGIAFDEILEFVASRLHVAPSFTERIEHKPFRLGRPAWVNDESFDLSYHVRQIALPAPGDWQQFRVQVARLAERPLDLDRPPWELYVIEGLEAIGGVAPGSFAVLLKLHQAAVGDATGVDILTALHDTSQSVPSWPQRKPVAEQRGGNPIGSLAGWAVHMATRPLAVAMAVVPPLIDMSLSLLRRSDDSSRGRTTLLTATRFNHPLGPHRSFGAVHFPLADVRALRAGSPGSTVNDVGLALIAGGLRQYLDEKGELPDSSLLALTPVTLRQDAGASEDRQFGTTIASLATHREHPLARLQVIHHCTQALKQNGAVDARSLLGLAEVLPGALVGSVQRAIVGAVSKTGRTLGFHTVITNVPGPRIPLYFCGARATMLTGMSPVHDGVGLTHAISSYDGTVTLSFTADRLMLPDPDVYERCIRESFDALMLAVQPTGATRKS